MSYFRSFPRVNYQFPNDIVKSYKDLTIRPAIVDELLNEPSNLETYTIQEGETPETIAFDKYGDVSMHWIIMLANDTINIYQDWPKSNSTLDDYLLDKYRQQEDSDGVLRTLTDTQVNEFIDFVGLPETQYRSDIQLLDSDNSPRITLRPHHFVDADGYEYSVNSLGLQADARGRFFDLPTITPVSHYQYEFDLNEESRVISLPYNNIAQRIKRELRELLDD